MSIPISQLPVLSTANAATAFPVVAAGATQQISGANLLAYFTAGNTNGTVTNVSFSNTNGFVGTVANSATLPNVTINVDGTHYLPTTTDEANWNAKQATINFADAEIPTGNVNGVNLSFKLAHTPNPNASLLLILGGLVLSHTANIPDYTLTGNTITYVTAPGSGATHEAFYRY